MTIRLNSNEIDFAIVQLQKAQTYFKTIGIESDFSFIHKKLLAGVEVILIQTNLVNHSINFQYKEKEDETNKNLSLNIIGGKNANWTFQNSSANFNKGYFFHNNLLNSTLTLLDSFNGCILLYFLQEEWIQENVPSISFPIAKIQVASSLNVHLLNQAIEQSTSELDELRILGQLFYNCIGDISTEKRVESYDSKIEFIIETLLKHLNTHQPKSKELAQSVGISESSLKSKFKKQTGLSIREYFFKEKMLTAKMQLLQGKQVKEIASNLGYSNSSNFSNAFKKEFGINPSEINYKTLKK